MTLGTNLGEYVGVPLTVLLTDAGFDPQALKAVKAVAADGFTVNYGPELFLLDDTLLAYGSTDGPLTAEDGTFRRLASLRRNRAGG